MIGVVLQLRTTSQYTQYHYNHLIIKHNIQQRKQRF